MWCPGGQYKAGGQVSQGINSFPDQLNQKIDGIKKKVKGINGK